MRSKPSAGGGSRAPPFVPRQGLALAALAAPVGRAVLRVQRGPGYRDFALTARGMDIAALKAADFRWRGGLAVTMRVWLGRPKDLRAVGALGELRCRSDPVLLPLTDTRLLQQRKGDG
jgi:hypothetical protein